MRAALIACLIATPLAAQDTGSRLPVFPPPTDSLPQVREREVPSVRQTARPGINVVSRSVWGTRPRPRPVEGAALVEAPTQPDVAPIETAASGTLPGLADRVEQVAVPVTTPVAPDTADATPAVLPAPQTPVSNGPVILQAQGIPLPQTRPSPRRTTLSPVEDNVIPVQDAVVATPAAPETDSIAPGIEDVLNTLRQEQAENPGGADLPEMRPAEEVISGAIVVETLGGGTAETLGLRPRSAPLEAVETAPGAVLRGLDKVSGTVRDIELAVGETARLGRLSVSLTECRYPVANPSGNAYAWLDITVEGLSDPAFQGWMLAASPALSALDHPRYDVWVIRCNTS